jgi:glucoamylase
MPKSLVLGNGNMLISLDMRAQVKDFYFPYVGLENQAGSLFTHRIGVFVEDQFAWFDDESWEIHINYQENTLVSDIQAINNELQVRVDFNDVIYNEKNIFIRKATVHNLADRPRQIKLFFHQQFEIFESYIGDSGYFDPIKNVVVHYKGKRVIMINATCGKESFDDYSVGNFGIDGKQGTYVDAEDGMLMKSPVEHGRVDSVIGMTVNVLPRGEAEIFYWAVAGKSLNEAHELNLYVLEKGPAYLIGTTRDFWRAWVNRDQYHFKTLDDSVVRLFKKSMLIMRTHVDNRGAIIASGDTDVLYQGKDTYAYVWPRDAALIAMSLNKINDPPIVKKFFEFCNEAISWEGYFWHRYKSDGSLGSSWHAWIRNGKPELPIQEDETAMIIIAIWQYYNLTKDIEFIEQVYNSLIKKAAEFMVVHRDDSTGLPKPSFDLWEQSFGIHTYTAATVYAALTAAGKFAAILGKTDAENRYNSAAKGIQEAIMEYLYNTNDGYFYKSVTVENKMALADTQLDVSSAYGVMRYGVLPASDERLQKAWQKTETELEVGLNTGGLVRLKNDPYYQAVKDSIGNPWFVTTLWKAQYYLAIAKTEADLQPIKQILAWVVKYALPSGVLSEQINPETGEVISVAPLIWSHSEFVTTVLNYVEKLEELGLCPECNAGNK